MENRILRLENKLENFMKEFETVRSEYTRQFKSINERLDSFSKLTKELINERLTAIEKQLNQNLQNFNKKFTEMINNAKDNITLNFQHEIANLKSEFNLFKNEVNVKIKIIDVLQKDLKNLEDIKSKIDELSKNQMNNIDIKKLETHIKNLASKMDLIEDILG